MHDSNRTAGDAHMRLSNARIGSLVNPTETYLLTLRNLLYRWIEDIDDTLARLHAQEDSDAQN